MEDYNSYTKPKVKLFFDIETIPAPEENRQAAIELGLKRMSQKIGKSKVTDKQLEEAYRWSAISGDFGQIFCVGYALNNEGVQIISGSEEEILNQWWNVAYKADIFIGHNIMEFDLRFIFKRSIVHGIKPSARHLNLSFARYRNFPIFDTMREWEKWSQSYISLDTLAKILNLPTSKDVMDGSQVYDFYKNGKFEEIYNYCKKDVALTREIYKKMVFANS